METPANFDERPMLPFENAIRPVYQPIARLACDRVDTIGFEALARGPKGAWARPLAMFEAARRTGMLEHLDRHCIALQLAAAADAPESLAIFVNVHPQTLRNDPGFPAFLVGTAMRYLVEPRRLVLEVLEHARGDQTDDRQLIAALNLLRGLGVRVAADDVAGVVDALGAGALRPDFLKLDASLLRDARHSLWARDILRMVADDAAASGAAVIAEGVETEGDMLLAEEAGITLVQGFYLGTPEPAVLPVSFERTHADAFSIAV